LINQIEQAANGALVEEVIDVILNEEFELGEEVIDHCSQLWSFKGTSESKYH
jgi:hypothetical protein